MNPSTHPIEKAIAKAIELHAGQKRKGGGNIPYVVHPLEVGMMVARYTNSEELIAAAILHDTVEDSAYPIEDLETDFGQEIRNLVSALTEDKSVQDWADRKSENIKRLMGNQDAHFIKCADALANMRSLVFALQEEGGTMWSRFSATKAQKLSYYKAILKGAMEFVPKLMLEEYISLLKDLEYSEAFEKKPALGFKEK